MAIGTSFHLSLCEHGNDALMVGFVRILVNALMQRMAGRHRIKKQNHPRQQEGNERLAELV